MFEAVAGLQVEGRGATQIPFLCVSFFNILPSTSGVRNTSRLLYPIQEYVKIARVSSVSCRVFQFSKANSSPTRHHPFTSCETSKSVTDMSYDIGVDRYSNVNRSPPVRAVDMNGQKVKADDHSLSPHHKRNDTSVAKRALRVITRDSFSGNGLATKAKPQHEPRFCDNAISRLVKGNGCAQCVLLTLTSAVPSEGGREGGGGGHGQRRRRGGNQWLPRSSLIGLMSHVTTRSVRCSTEHRTWDVSRRLL